MRFSMGSNTSSALTLHTRLPCVRAAHCQRTLLCKNAVSDAVVTASTVGAVAGFTLSGVYCVLDSSQFDPAAVSARLPEGMKEPEGYAVNAYDETGELLPELLFNVGLVLAFVPVINWTVRILLSCADAMPSCTAGALCAASATTGKAKVGSLHK